MVSEYISPSKADTVYWVADFRSWFVVPRRVKELCLPDPAHEQRLLAGKFVFWNLPKFRYAQAAEPAS
jgi:hypothetical protein